MALRIGSGAPPPMEEELPTEEMPVEEEMPMEEEVPEAMSEEPMDAGGTVDPMVAGYRGPEMGPFACGNCIHYADNGMCSIVAGPVDEGGLCNLFTGPEVQTEEMPMEGEMPTEELPAEEAPLPEEPPVEE